MVVVAVELKLQIAAAATKAVALSGSSSEVRPVAVGVQRCKSKAHPSKADLQMVVGTAGSDLERDYIGAELLKLGFVLKFDALELFGADVMLKQPPVEQVQRQLW